MRSYSVLAINVYITEASFHYTECGTAKLLLESLITKRYMYIKHKTK